MPLDPNKFTRKTGEALGAAQALARDLHHSQVTSEHLLAALAGQPESVVIPVLERIGVSSKTRKATPLPLPPRSSRFLARCSIASLCPAPFRSAPSR